MNINTRTVIICANSERAKVIDNLLYQPPETISIKREDGALFTYHVHIMYDEFLHDDLLVRTIYLKEKQL